MADLWADKRAKARQRAEPLALRMRPRRLDKFIGQTHILSPGSLLGRMLKARALTSIILHGPPGTGKTTLAGLIADAVERPMYRENAAGVSVKRIRAIIDEATRRLELEGKQSILFLDEIHRFSKSQQDVLLADVERGTITLIGATTENPLFACNSALVSRSTLFRLEPLSEEEIIKVLKEALTDRQRGYGSMNIRISDDALQLWAIKCDGDARRALNALEVAVLSGGAQPGQAPVPAAENQPAPIIIDRATAEASMQDKAAVYEGTGDGHYDSISAMIKSVRGSDPDAAIYWIARMLHAGEDPAFIARRLAILASEDIGNADPRAIVIADAAWSLVTKLGMPEARITLSQCAIYLALAPKSNASYRAIDAALADVREDRTQPVPLYLRDPHSSPVQQGVPANNTGPDRYAYSHNAPDRVEGLPITGQHYLSVAKAYYEPTDAGAEAAMARRLARVRALREALGKSNPSDAQRP